MDLFDSKPGLDALRGVELPDSIRKGQRLTGMTSKQDRFLVHIHFESVTFVSGCRGHRKLHHIGPFELSRDA